MNQDHDTEPARIKFYWMTGCSSCLRTKEFLTRQGIAFESINLLEHPDAMARLNAQGIRSIPVITLGDRYTLCQSFSDVLQFLDLPERLAPPLPPAELIEKLDIVLAVAVQTLRQIPAEQLNQAFRERPRTRLQLAFHIFRVVEMGLGAAQGKGMAYEAFFDTPPTEWSRDDVVNWGLRVRSEVRAWWNAQEDRELKYKISTYYGDRELHDTLERITWHAAQHTRQLVLMLEEGGTQAERPLTQEDLQGLPVPEAVWG